MTLGVRKMKLLGVATAAILALGASGCSSLPTAPDWVDPTTWFGGDDSGPDDGQTPDLAGMPDKPAAQTPDEQQKVAESLASDRANAKYSADALRGGNEPAAAPPSDAPPAVVADEPVVAAKPRPGAAPPPPPTQVATVDRSMAQDPTGNTAPGTLPATQPGTPVMTAETPAAEPVKTAELPEAAPPPAPPKKSKPVRVAEVAPPPPVAETPAAVPQTPVAAINPSDAELGFAPSSAPPLDPSVSQFVAAPIVDHYRSTATSGMTRYSSSPSAVASATPRKHRIHRAPKPAVAMGGPEHMEGKVVANLDSLGTPVEPQPSFANVSGATAVVYFPHDTVGVNATGRAQVRAAVEQFKASGGQGYIRVVGHSSSRTPNMSAEAHLALIFKKSQQRAEAVAREIIRAGIPADRVLVEAVGDSQPVYYESMPKGEDGNRRAEIFVGG